MQAVADFDVADFENPNSGKGLHARFYLHPEQDDVRSSEEGRPIFVDVEYIEILAPGNSTNIIQRRVRETDRIRFPRQYEAFKAGLEEYVSGTLLSEVPWITKSQVEELKYLRIRTLEQLAELSDTVVQKHMGLVTLKRKAQDWVKASASAAPLTALQAQNEAMQRRLEELERQLETRSEAPTRARKPKLDLPGQQDDGSAEA